jgi:hypothetical protein
LATAKRRGNPHILADIRRIFALFLRGQERELSGRDDVRKMTGWLCADQTSGVNTANETGTIPMTVSDDMGPDSMQAKGKSGGKMVLLSARQSGPIIAVDIRPEISRSRR